MIGKLVTKHCRNCNDDVSIRVGTGHMIDDKVYFININCPNCGSNLSSRDRSTLIKSKLRGKKVSVVMY